MEKYTLEAQKRTERGHIVRRVAGTRIPATVYGQGMEAMTVWVESAVFARVFAKAGETAVIELSVDGAKKALPTIVRDIQYSPLKHTIIHIDFYQVSLKEAVTADIPVVLVGEAPAVKLGGTIMQGTSTIEVSALPSNLPHEISVDITSLATFDDSIMVGDITAPEKVTITSDPSLMLASVAAPRVEEKDEEEKQSAQEEEAPTEKEPAENAA